MALTKGTIFKISFFRKRKLGQNFEIIIVYQGIQKLTE